MGKTSDILRQLADMIDDGCFEHLSEDDLDGAKKGINGAIGCGCYL